VTTKHITKQTLEVLGRTCARCSIHYNDPHLIEPCRDINQQCWVGCPVCFPDQYANAYQREIDL